MNSTHKGPVTQKKLPFDDVIMRDTLFPRGLFCASKDCMHLCFSYKNRHLIYTLDQWAACMYKSLHFCRTVRGRDHFVYAPSQLETTLQYKVVSHLLGAPTKWSVTSSLIGWAHTQNDPSKSAYAEVKIFVMWKRMEVKLSKSWSLVDRVTVQRWCLHCIEITACVYC